MFKAARLGRVVRDTRVVFSIARLTECHLARSQDGHCRFWLDRTAIGISSQEFGQIRAAFPEIDVREAH